MKRFLFVVQLPLLTCCSQPSQSPPHAQSISITQRTLFVLPNAKFKIDGVTTDFAGALARMGPPGNTQINLTVCPDLKTAVLQKALADVKHAGYDHISFNSIDGAPCAEQR